MTRAHADSGAALARRPQRQRGRRIGALFSVLVCPLDGVNGADGAQAGSHLARALKGREGLRVRALRGSPTAIPRREGGLVPLLARTTETAQHWLAREGADVLLWGQRAGDTIRLSVVSHGHRQDLDASLRWHPWSTLQLPLPLTPAGVDLVHTFLLAAIAPADPVIADAHGRALGRALDRVDAHLDEGHAPPGPLRDGVRVAIGLLLRAHGLRRRDPIRLGRAIRLLEEGLDNLEASWPKALRTLARVDWAEAVLALPVVVGRRSDARAQTVAGLEPARLDAAVAACEAGLDLLPLDQVPLARASVATTLARGLRRQARRTGRVAALDRAVEALQQARMVWTASAEPVRWRRLWMAEGLALTERAGLLGDAAAAHARAARAYATLLEGLSVGDDPETWARARANLGAALLGSLGRTPYDAGAPELLGQVLHSLGMGPSSARSDTLTEATWRAAALCLREALVVRERLGLKDAAAATRRDLEQLLAAFERLGAAPPPLPVRLPGLDGLAAKAPPADSDDDPDSDAEARRPDTETRPSAVVLPFRRRAG